MFGENDESMMHENDAAMVLLDMCKKMNTCRMVRSKKEKSN